MNDNNIKFKSLGAHLRNLLTPYANLVQITKDLIKAQQKQNNNETKLILELLQSKLQYFDNLKDIIEFSQMKEIENINYLETELYKKQMALEEIDKLTKILGT